MTDAMLTELRTVAGANAVTSGHALERVGVAWAAVIAPETAAAAAAVFSLCSREGWPVLAAGNGTRAAGVHAALQRMPPGTRPVLVTTSRMAAIVEHEPADLVVGVTTGMTHARLAAQLSSAKQELALDPPTSPDSTIGGTLAMGAAGPLRAAHGLARDAALGVEIVTGDGRVLRFGGRVVKNVAGYDGVRMIVGSGGALGLITAAFLRLRGAPRADRTLVITAGSAEAAAQVALAIREAVSCDALELLSPLLARDLGLQNTWSVLARVRGGNAAVADAIARVTQAANGAVSDTNGNVWPQLSRLEAAGAHAFEAVSLPAELPELLAIFNHGYVAAHAADGVVRGWGREALPGAAAEKIVSRGWTFRYAGLPARRESADPGATELGRRLQAAFDPAGILLPRLVIFE